MVLFGRKNDTAQTRWDAANLRTVGTRLRTEQTELFDQIVYGYALTRYEAVRRFCLAVIKNPSLLASLDWE